jgi:hypothetical protein
MKRPSTVKVCASCLAWDRAKDWRRRNPPADQSKSDPPTDKPAVRGKSKT